MEATLMEAVNLDAALERKIIVAVGKKRSDDNWVNTPMTWGGLAARLKEVKRTSETVSEFARMPKKSQDDVKDVGGYVGGELDGRRRGKSALKSRHVLTLDVDNAADDSMMGMYETLYGNAAVWHSTHKHTPRRPRLRLCALLDRPASPDEYSALARKVAESLGMAAFDPTTFQPERLMYWPSAPKDGEFLYRLVEGPPLGVDETLASYGDWRDASLWPSCGEERAPADTVQEDPTSKPGAVGAFCRCHSVDSAVERYLAKIYLPCGPGRYTYAQGSSTGGLVVYEGGKFAYSFHSTDPASGKLCNAFDLVRLHLFGHLDKEGDKAGAAPSFKRMASLAMADQDVQALKLDERLAKSRARFAQADEDEAGEAGEAEAAKETASGWSGELAKHPKTGELLSVSENVRIILENDELLKGMFAYDFFRHTPVLTSAPPWRSPERTSLAYGDQDDAGLRNYLQVRYNIDRPSHVYDGLSLVFEAHGFHPVKEYLSGLAWDGEKRLDRWAIDYYGAVDSAYTRAVTRKTFVAAVARIHEPGVKFDCVLTLCGRQGSFKSTGFRIMGSPWYKDGITSLQGTDAFEMLQGAWLVELAELSVFKKAEVEQIKHFVTIQEDNYRMKYGRRTHTYPRSCVFVGTTNRGDFLRDATGNRRWWPVDVRPERVLKPISRLESERDQLWAEAVELYNAREPLFLSAEEEQAASDAQSAHTEDDPNPGLIEEFLSKPVPRGWDKMDIQERLTALAFGGSSPDGEPRQKICVQEIWCELFKGDLKSLDRRRVCELHDSMRKVAGWKRYEGGSAGRLKFGAYGHQTAYVRAAGP
jgi:predicted P-loop ATPase